MTDSNGKVYVEYMALGDLLERQHPANPKRHDIGAIILSFQEFGYVAPGVIDELTGKFVCGHGRTQALQMMKQQKIEAPERIEARADDWYVPTYRGVTFENALKVKAYLVADNRLTTLGGWDEPALLENLKELAAHSEQVLVATGYDLDDIEQLSHDVTEGIYSPDYNPGSDGKTYTAEDIAKAQAELHRKLKQIENGQLELCCPGCLETFFVNVKDFIDADTT